LTACAPERLATRLGGRLSPAWALSPAAPFFAPPRRRCLCPAFPPWGFAPAAATNRPTLERARGGPTAAFRWPHRMARPARCFSRTPRMIKMSFASYC